MEKNSNELIRESAVRTLFIQQDGIAGLSEFINDDFVRAVEIIAKCAGRVVVSGIGKSAIVAQKIVATMNSTGSPALFMHAADAIHGDLGMIREDDIVLVISKSGDSPEIKVLAPLVKNFGNVLIGMTGNILSYLAAQSDIVIDTTVRQEACPNNLAPTTSTTAQMVMGDAIAICLMEVKGFQTKDFARFHPGGAIGKKLYLRVSELILSHAKPAVEPTQNVKQVIIEITKSRLGAAAVIDENKIVGIVTDGDVRRMFEKFDSFTTLSAKDIMSPTPKSIDETALAAEALELMRAHNINQLIVTTSGSYAGIVHLQDLIREGII